MPKKRRPSLISNKFSTIFIVLGIIFIIFGVFIYIQDSQKRSQSPDETGIENQEKDQDAKIAVDEAKIEVEHLNQQLEKEVKTETSEEPKEKPAQKVEAFINNMSYDASSSILRLGLSFDSAITTHCSFSLSGGGQKSVSKRVQAVNAGGRQGCSFNNLDLSSLPTPTTASPWKMLVIVQKDNQELSRLEKTIISTGDLKI